MTTRELLVHVELDAVAVPCGRLWARSLPRPSASFEYDAAWLARRGRFALEPSLPLGRGQFHTASALFPVLGDTAPDRWGQTLMRRMERVRARREGRAPRSLGDVDFMTGVDDRTRLGALRYAEPAAPNRFLATSERPVPPLLELPRLLSATRRVLTDEETDEDLDLVLAPGTSLGGARPKASVRGADGTLYVAKFARDDDDWPVIRWEATALALAVRCGLRVPASRLETVARKAVLLVTRFDRTSHGRVPYMSAMTAITASDGDARSYLDIVDALRREGSHAREDLHELWSRMVFNILISNTDDHLRNHGFLRDARGWRLAPAFDLNPVPVDVRPRVHALAIDETDPTASLETALAVAPRFGVAAKAARARAAELARGVKTWRVVAAKAGLKPRDLDRMASAFEHADLTRALR